MLIPPASFYSAAPHGRIVMRQVWCALVFLGSCLFFAPSFAADAKRLTDYFPPPEDQGGWRSLAPESSEPTAEQKAKIREQAGCDWDKLNEAWKFNAESPGATGL